MNIQLDQKFFRGVRILSKADFTTRPGLPPQICEYVFQRCGLTLAGASGTRCKFGEGGETRRVGI